MSSSFFPVPDSEFEAWLGKFHEGFGENWQAWGFCQADCDTLRDAIASWRSALKGRSVEAGFARSLVETLVTGVANQLRSLSGLSEADWSQLGFSAPPETSQMPVASPALHIEPTSSGSFTISWNTAIHPVWNSILLQGRHPGGEWEDLVTVATALTPATFEKAHSQFRACWISSVGARGPWSAIGCVEVLAA